MSYRVSFQTVKQFTPDQMFDKLMENGNQIMIISDEFPVVKLGTIGTSLRGIDVICEDDGYEVCAHALCNVSDYELFVDIIDTIYSLTEALPVNEEDENVPIPAKSMFDNDWIKSMYESMWNIAYTMIRSSGGIINFQGLFMDVCLGPTIFNSFDIKFYESFDIKKIEELEAYLTRIQWLCKDKRSTRTRMVLKDPEAGEGGRNYTISAIMAKNGEFQSFDYVSMADLFAVCILDDPERKPRLIPSEYIGEVLSDGFSRLDECQYVRTQDLTMETVIGIYDRLRFYEPANLFRRPAFPGQGYDKGQHTVVFMWDPANSDVTIKEFIETIPDMLTEPQEWYVDDYENVRMYDQFYVVKCGGRGNGPDGVVMSGILGSNPRPVYANPSHQRVIYYTDLIPNVMVNPSVCPLLTLEELMVKIQDLDWTSDCSGRVLSELQAVKLQELWKDYLEKNSHKSDFRNMVVVKRN